MLALRLFLPESWTSQWARLERAGVPAGYRTARTKPELALTEIDRVIAAGLRFGCVLADAGCSTNYLIDVENAIVVDVEAATAIRQAEVLAAKRMIERSMDRFELYPARLMGDSAYGSADMLSWLVYEHGIEPHVTVFDKSARKDGTFSRDHFTYDPAGDVYYCPGGSKRRANRRLQGSILRTRADQRENCVR